MARKSKTADLDLGPHDLDAQLMTPTFPARAGRRSVAVQRGASVRNQTYEALRRAIVSCRIPPHTSLSEQEVAEALGISRTPVREALLRLSDEGLVVIVPQQGTVTAPISIMQVREAQLVREVLERAALTVAHQVARDESFLRMDVYLQEQRRAVERDDLDTFFLLDQQFHADLASLSGYENLGRIASNARAHLDRIRSLMLHEDQDIDVLIAEHDTVVRAMADGDLATADQTLTFHLRRVLESFPTMRLRHPDFFTDEPEPNIPPPHLAIGLERDAIEV